MAYFENLGTILEIIGALAVSIWIMRFIDFLEKPRRRRRST